jgi:hypothetical protein
MSDEDLIRRVDARDAVHNTPGPIEAMHAILALPAVQTFTAADLSWPAQIARIKAEMFSAADLEAAFRLALEMAGDACMIVRGQQRDTMAMISAEKCAAAIRALTPPTDLAARVEEARR